MMMIRPKGSECLVRRTLRRLTQDRQTAVVLLAFARATHYYSSQVAEGRTI